MKKFLAIVFSLIFALSACTVAFAAAQYECTACHAILADQKAFDAHNNGGCLVLFTTCEYCNVTVATENANAHTTVCPKAYADCKYCGIEYHKANLAAHEKICTEANGNATTDGKQTYTCPVCSSIFNDKAAYEEHTTKTCLVAFKDCPYCEAKVAAVDLDAHKADCPKGACKCDYCGEDFKNQGEYDLHIEPCKAKYFKIPVSKLFDKVVELVKGINWAELAEKVIGVVKGIDFNGLLAKVKPLFEKIPELLEGIIPAAK